MKRNIITLLTAAVLLTSTPQVTSAAATPVPVGKINLPVNFRSGPTTDSDVYSTLQPGTSIKILREVNSHWLRVKVGVKTGYVSASYVDYKPTSTTNSKDSTNSSTTTIVTASSAYTKSSDSASTANATISTETTSAPAAVSPSAVSNKPGTGVVGKGVNFRAQPTTGSPVLRVLAVGESFTALEQPSAAWIKIKDKNGVTGYVSADYVSYTLPPSETAVLNEVPAQTIDEVEDLPYNPPQPAVTMPSLATGSPLDEASADRIIASALALQGVTHYGFGKNEAPTLFDCSSFTRYIYGLEGIDLAWGTRYQKDVGIEVERGQWQKGDLLFFSGGDPSVITHVGIYAGDNKLIHNSPSLDGIAISNLDLNYWVDHYVTARRILR
ncbi:C40 family peptidase [Paenibacillus wulumuqiensis]|uniref:C40 family peptidase n=1 Tax=Paenibacillus wulumuqiensis TaxID=1567107 RepID=UPI000619779C|nr:C40 family peptidase [Paenibacillus wulumuqiensis]